MAGKLAGKNNGKLVKIFQRKNFVFKIGFNQIC